MLMYRTAMLFGTLRVLLSLPPSVYMKVYAAGLSIAVTYCFVELGYIALKKYERNRKMKERKQKYEQTMEERRVRWHINNVKKIRSLNADIVKYKARTATLEVESRQKDIKIITLKMKKRALKTKIRKFEDREALMQTFGLLASNKNV
jgi:hypothetical protein